MVRPLARFAFLLAILAAVAPRGVPRTGGGTQICHFEANGARTIAVAEAEVAAHLAHGDLPGRCGTAIADATPAGARGSAARP